MRQNTILRRSLAPLKRSPYHPQWFVYKNETKTLAKIGQQAYGLILNYAAGAQKIREFLRAGSQFISLDFLQTATEWYHRPAGRLVPQVPFLYPLHDGPYDFHHWTIHGLRVLATRFRFFTDQEVYLDPPVESKALLANLTLNKSALNWFRIKNPLLVFTSFLLGMIPLDNIHAWVLAHLGSEERFMSHSYRVIWIKQA